MKVWVIYKCKRYEDTKVPFPCVIAVITEEEKAKSLARAEGAWMTQVEVDRVDAKGCRE